MLEASAPTLLLHLISSLTQGLALRRRDLAAAVLPRPHSRHTVRGGHGVRGVLHPRSRRGARRREHRGRRRVHARHRAASADAGGL
ncbi:hypothetical protein JKP88DRAFT_84894 [Tribonema minus]|uniref:Uncharacterized protein n=1 Tax=Tribonema minus TaxID=303371 RepID=A0A835YNC2_9STRA|nr:hypothetical protein JKP88DRAFT_84894 [Tribonema minus]